MNIKNFITTFGIISALFVSSFNAEASEEHLLKKIDVFTTILDQSGSMYMSSKQSGTKMMIAKKVIENVSKEIPSELKYNTEFMLACNDKVVYDGKFEKGVYDSIINGIPDYNAIFGRLTPLWSSIETQVDEKHDGRAEAVILITDGDWNIGQNPVDTVKALYDKHPNLICHIISFADTENGIKTVNAIKELNSQTILISAYELLDEEKVKWFVEEVFYGRSTPFEIFFDFDKSALTEEATRALDVIPSTKLLYDEIEIVGWTDKIGTKRYNKTLSQRRAETVRKYINTDKNVTSIGSGVSTKYDTNKKNRRVDVILK